MIVLVACHCTANRELDLANTFTFIMIYWPPPNSVTLHIQDNSLCKCGRCKGENNICGQWKGRAHTGLSLRDDIGILASPWTTFFESWTSTIKASPWLNGKLKVGESSGSLWLLCVFQQLKKSRQHVIVVVLKHVQCKSPSYALGCVLEET